MSRFALLLIMILGPTLVQAQPAAAPDQQPLVRALKDELTRSMKLSLPRMSKPYYLAYSVVDIDQGSIVGEFGGLVRRQRSRGRHLRVDLRVGDPSFDNSNFLAGYGHLRPTRLVQEDDYAALRRQIWLATDRAYKQAVDLLEKKRAARASRQRDPDDVGDFSKAPTTRVTSRATGSPPDLTRLSKLARQLSALFWEYPQVQEGNVFIDAVTRTRTFVSSEGSVSIESRRWVGLRVSASTQADDGMALKHRYAVAAAQEQDLPAPAVLEKEVRRVLSELSAMRVAEVVKGYSGPVLFEGPAAAQILRTLLVPNLCGTPAPLGPQGRRGTSTSFAEKIDRQVLPARFDIRDEPALERHKGIPLVGGYRVDDEGVPAQPVQLVEGGKLKAFLMSRTPRKGFPRSNGHGRAGLVGRVKGQISNLMVRVGRPLSDRALRRRLLAQSRAAGEEFGLVIRLLDDGGHGSQRRLGFLGLLSMLGRRNQRDRLKPLVVVKVTRDGKETPVRGVELGELPATALKQIVAAGRELYVHNDPASGSPTAVVTPSLLFREVEVLKAKAKRDKPPLVPRPGRSLR